MYEPANRRTSLTFSNRYHMLWQIFLVRFLAVSLSWFKESWISLAAQMPKRQCTSLCPRTVLCHFWVETACTTFTVSFQQWSWAVCVRLSHIFYFETVSMVIEAFTLGAQPSQSVLARYDYQVPAWLGSAWFGHVCTLFCMVRGIKNVTIYGCRHVRMHGNWSCTCTYVQPCT